MTNRAECVDFLAWRDAHRPHGIAEVIDLAGDDAAGVARGWNVAGVGSWVCEGELKSVRWSVAVDPMTGAVLTRIVCDGSEYVHALHPDPEETEAERRGRDGVLRYLSMIFALPFGVQRQIAVHVIPLLVLVSLVA